MDTSKVAVFLKKLRIEKGLTQNQLSEMLYIDRGAISKWERGINIPSYDMLLKLSALYKVSVDEILYGERKTKLNEKDINNIKLKIIDISNKKILVMKNINKLLIIFIFILLLIYFLNNYNTIYLYQIGIEDDTYNSSGGIVFVSKKQMYLRFGIISPDESYNSMNLYYKDKEKLNLLVTNDKEFIYTIKFGKDQVFSYSEYKKILNNLYIDLYNNSKKLKTIKVHYYQIFNNTSFVDYDNNSYKNSNVEISNTFRSVPKYIEDNFEYNGNNNSYYKEYSNYNIQYIPSIGELIISDDEYIYYYYFDNEIDIVGRSLTVSEQVVYNMDFDKCDRKCDLKRIHFIIDMYIKKMT